MIGAICVGGVFDSLHISHVNLLKAAENIAHDAKAELVVLLNSEKSLALHHRIHQHSEGQRADLIQAVVPSACVSFFDELTPAQALRGLVDRFDDNEYVVFFKGSEVLETGDTVLPPEAGIHRVLLGWLPSTPGKYNQKLCTRKAP